MSASVVDEGGRKEGASVHIRRHTAQTRPDIPQWTGTHTHRPHTPNSKPQTDTQTTTRLPTRLPPHLLDLGHGLRVIELEELHHLYSVDAMMCWFGQLLAWLACKRPSVVVPTRTHTHVAPPTPTLLAFVKPRTTD